MNIDVPLLVRIERHAEPCRPISGRQRFRPAKNAAEAQKLIAVAGTARVQSTRARVHVVLVAFFENWLHCQQRALPLRFIAPYTCQFLPTPELHLDIELPVGRCSTLQGRKLNAIQLVFNRAGWLCQDWQPSRNHVIAIAPIIRRGRGRRSGPPQLSLIEVRLEIRPGHEYLKVQVHPPIALPDPSQNIFTADLLAFAARYAGRHA
ncbi:hypothetical protein D3C72_1228050 [compost metagenome]